MGKRPRELDEKELRKSTDRIRDAWEFLRKHVLLGPVAVRAKLFVINYQPQQPGMFATVSGAGDVYANPYNWPRKKDEWIFVLAHALLHLAFGHTRHMQRGIVWNIACDCVINEFLGKMKIGAPPDGLVRLPGGQPNNEEKLYQMWTQNGAAPEGETTNGRAGDMAAGESKKNFEEIFAKAARNAARVALSKSAGEELTLAQQARSWHVRNYPLLGSVLQHFKIDEHPRDYDDGDMRIGAVDCAAHTIFINPGWALNDKELRFVLAHFALHAAFQHPQRRKARVPFIWNAACDYCVNEWLEKMPPLAAAAKPPAEGHLRSIQFDGLSPEEIYDKLSENPKAAHKLVTFAGQDVCDMQARVLTGPALQPARIDRVLLDSILRGYHLHTEAAKGTLPAGLIEELRRLENPPLPWDVQLGRWFDEHIPPVERVRTYARPSRRQSSTPSIARPRYVWPDIENMVKGTFGLIVDTSGSLNPTYATLALGAISTYALSRAIPLVRLVLSGAELIDAGMIGCDELLQKFSLSKRSSAALQPAVELFDNARDFPEDAPLLLVTGLPCDRVKTPRTHAFLVPEEGRLTYATDATVIGIVAD